MLLAIPTYYAQPDDDDLSTYQIHHQTDDYYSNLLSQLEELIQEEKRSPYNFGVGKRSPYNFGVGKRSPYNFGVGKRDPYNFGVGKRSLRGWGKRMPYNFGVGR